MKDHFLIRDADIRDIDFLVEATFNADKGNGDIIHYCTLFNISEIELQSILKKIFLEDVTGFEFSIRNFMVAEHENYPVATYAGWIEGIGGVPSRLLKISAFRTFLSKRNIAYYESVAHIDSEIGIKRDNSTLQLETTYVRQDYRGKGIVHLLTNALIKKTRDTNPTITKAQVQLFKENQRAFLIQSKLGFKIIEERTSNNPEILKYLPGKTRIKMEKIIS